MIYEELLIMVFSMVLTSMLIGKAVPILGSGRLLIFEWNR